MTERPKTGPVTHIQKQSSKLVPYSLGIAANNKKVGSDILLVTPIEALTMLDGEIASSPHNKRAQGVDASGDVYQTTVTQDLAIQCTWYPVSNSNRRTSPDVRRGERVMIYRFADRNEYVWQSLGMDDHLRKLETVVFSISGTPDESIDGTLPENSYFVEMSTHNGSITVQTSKQNGEFSSYAIQIDAKNGKIIAADALGNKIVLDSAETLIELTNADNTTVQLDKQKILLKAEQSITAEAGEKIHIKTKHFIVDADKSSFSKDIEVGGQSKFGGAMKANGITSPEPISGPSGTI